MKATPPNKVQAKLLAEAHEKAAEVMRKFSQGKCTVEELSREYSKLTGSVQSVLTETAEWRHKVQHGERD